MTDFDLINEDLKTLINAARRLQVKMRELELNHKGMQAELESQRQQINSLQVRLAKKANRR